jgi:hypothetical protein
MQQAWDGLEDSIRTCSVNMDNTLGFGDNPAGSPSSTMPWQRPQVMHVLPGQQTAGWTDNLTLRCAGGNRVVCSAELLALASPVVLRGAVEAARGPAGTGGCPGGTVELPMPADAADDWLTALRMIHPGVLPRDRPNLSWVRPCGRG